LATFWWSTSIRFFSFLSIAFLPECARGKVGRE